MKSISSRLRRSIPGTGCGSGKDPAGRDPSRAIPSDSEKSSSTASTVCAAGEGGTVLIIVAFSLVALLGFAGLAIDFGYYFSQKAKMQSLVDSAAIACGLNECQQSTAQQNLNAAVLKPINADNVALDVQPVLTGVAECPGDATGCFRVTGRSTLDTFFLRTFNIPTLDVTATATATAGFNAKVPGAVPAILALGVGGLGVSINTSLNVSVRGDVDSNAGVTVANLGSQNINGNVVAVGVANVGKATVTGKVVSNHTPNFNDPCAGALKPENIDKLANFATCQPNVVASPQANISCPGNKRTIASGTYCSLDFRIPTQCNVTMNGNYFVRDGVRITGNPNTSVTAANTFLYNKSGGFAITDIRGVLTMKPPTSGLFRGVLMFHGGAGAAEINLFNPNALMDLGGVLYAPAVDLTISSQQASPGMELTGIVARSITLGTGMTVSAPAKGVCSDLDGGGFSPRKVTLVR